MRSHSKPVLAIIGGTGPEGTGLAARFAEAGYSVIIGSRSAGRAQETVERLGAPGRDLKGMSNTDAALEADIILLTIPYAALGETLAGIERAVQGKIVVSAIAPVEFRDGRPVGIQPQAGSAAQEVALRLPGARVASAFQNVDAHLLASEEDLDTDVIVTSDDADARHAVMDLVSAFPGARSLSGGRLAASHYVEETTTLLVILNRIYKAHSGIRITGIRR